LYGDLKPYNTSSLILPYRNENFAFKVAEDYFIRVCPVYEENNFDVNLCGITLGRLDRFQGGNSDQDNDGLDDFEEYNLGTDPRNPDSDQDDIADSFEVHYGLDPNLSELPELGFDGLLVDAPKGNSFGEYDEQHQVISLENTGDRFLRIFGLRLEQDHDDFKIIDAFNRIDSLNPGEKLSFNLDFLPKRSGVSNARLVVLTDDRDNYPFIVDIDGVAENIANLHVRANQNFILFNEAEIGETYSQGGVFVSNQNADMPLKLSAYVKGSLGFNVFPRHFSLNPNQEVELEISFFPDWSGSYEGVLVIQGENDSKFKKVHFPIRANVAGEQPELRIRPRGLRFNQTRIGQNSSQIFRIHNEGDGVLYIKQVDLGIDEDTPLRDVFTFSSKQIVIPAHSSRPLQVNFKPDQRGVFRSQICIVTNDQGIGRNGNCNSFRSLGHGVSLPREAYEIEIVGEGI
jgi:hypothetical protein